MQTIIRSSTAQAGRFSARTRSWRAAPPARIRPVPKHRLKVWPHAQRRAGFRSASLEVVVFSHFVSPLSPYLCYFQGILALLGRKSITGWRRILLTPGNQGHKAAITGLRILQRVSVIANELLQQCGDIAISNPTMIVPCHGSRILVVGSENEMLDEVVRSLYSIPA